MLEATLSETIDSFIPWRDISKAYFQAREPEPAPAPAPEGSQATRIPVRQRRMMSMSLRRTMRSPRQRTTTPLTPLTLGEDIKLDDFDDETASVQHRERSWRRSSRAAEPLTLNL
jgi:hypothetical protein